MSQAYSSSLSGTGTSDASDSPRKSLPSGHIGLPIPMAPNADSRPWTLPTGQTLRRIAVLPPTDPGGLVRLPTLPPAALHNTKAEPAAAVLPKLEVAVDQMPLTQSSSSIAPNANPNPNPTVQQEQAGAPPALHTSQERSTAQGCSKEPVLPIENEVIADNPFFAIDKGGVKSAKRKCGLCGRMGHRKERCPGREELAVAVVAMITEAEEGGGVSTAAPPPPSSLPSVAQAPPMPKSRKVSAEYDFDRADTRIEYSGMHTPLQLTERAADEGKGLCAFCNSFRSAKRVAQGGGSEPSRAKDARHDNRTTRFKCFECDKFLCITESLGSSCWVHYHLLHFPHTGGEAAVDT